MGQSGNLKTNTKCRMCKGEQLVKILDFGEMPLANAFLKKEDLGKPEQKYPLRVFFCKECGLSQLIDVVRPEVLFRNYVYFSSGMPVLPQHFKDYAEDIAKNFTANNDFVVEIGSNDGLLLNAIKALGKRVLGVDPAINIAKIANERGVPTLADFFCEKTAKQIAKAHGQANAIIGNNVVAHIDDHHDLMRGIKTLLRDDGAFIFEAPYIIDMFENLAFDTIYHEHLSYLSILPLAKLFDKFGMEIFDVKTFPVQGNSLRVYVGNTGKHKISGNVSKFFAKEKEMGLDNVDVYFSLAKKIEQMKADVVELLKELKKQGKKIAGYGAPAKGNTLLNYFGIDSGILDYATEELPSKIGSYTPGTRIPIVHISDARKNPPDYFLLLAWNYKDAVLAKEKAFRDAGGKFIIPIGGKDGRIL